MLKSTKVRNAKRLHARGWSLRDIAAASNSTVREVAEAIKPRIRVRTKCQSARNTKPTSRPSIPREWKERIDEKCGCRCVFCGSTRYRDLQYDHIVPLSKGGQHTEENLQLACRLCNTSKNNRDAPTWHLPRYKRARKL